MALAAPAASALAPSRSGTARCAWLAWSAPSLALLFGMVFLPTAHQAWKGGLFLAALVVALGAELVRPRRTLHPHVVTWGAALCACGLAFMVRGLLHGAPGALAVGTVYVVWPAAFVALAGSAGDERVLRAHLKVLVAGVTALSIYGLAFALEQGGWLARSPFPELFSDQGIGLYDGYVEMRLPSLSVLPFAVPFLIAAAIAWRPGAGPVRARWVWLALVATTFLAMLSGRRAVLLVVALAVPLTFGLIGLLPRRERHQLLGAAAMLIVGLALTLVAVQAFAADIFGFDVTVLWQEFRLGFDPRATESSSIRVTQLRELIEAWHAHPLLGAGHGAFLHDHIRDPERPWGYELSYPTLLFQAGLAGLLAYAALIGWLILQMVRIVRAGGEHARTMLPLLVGLLAFLAANATNPYLLKFDFMWTLFLPLALVNRRLVERDRRRAPEIAGA